MKYCEDYPCCGHTPDNPCARQWYDKPGAFDTSRPGNEHALCDHENYPCEVEPPDPDDDEEDPADPYEYFPAIDTDTDDAAARLAVIRWNEY
jgi:hypothetical protein